MTVTTLDGLIEPDTPCWLPANLTKTVERQ